MTLSTSALAPVENLLTFSDSAIFQINVFGDATDFPIFTSVGELQRHGHQQHSYGQVLQAGDSTIGHDVGRQQQSL